MIRVGILTFHAAHNYGSMLQNYALQQVLKKIGVCPETINLRTVVQKEMYDYFKPFGQLIHKKRLFYKIVYYPWKKALLQKHSLFESFLADEIILSQEIASESEIVSLPYYDAYIVGSDQCWNMTAIDFNWSYFLGFAPIQSHRLSYAISMGPHPTKVERSSKEDLSLVKKRIKQFNGISVRDYDTASSLNRIVGEKMDIQIHVDPTLLLTTKEWEDLTSSSPIISGKYVFFYNPYWLENAYRQARALGEITGLPVYTSNPNIRGILQYPDFQKCYEVGPKEFLNLVKNAEYVVGRSFHLIVFCIIFKKKFIAVEGLGDSRIRQLLKMTNLESFATVKSNVKYVYENLDETLLHDAEIVIDKERERASSWLTQQLL